MNFRLLRTKSINDHIFALLVSGSSSLLAIIDSKVSQRLNIFYEGINEGIAIVSDEQTISTLIYLDRLFVDCYR